jgi:carboxyl-terminal processing protease
MRRTRPTLLLLAAAPLVVAGVIAARPVTHRADLFQEVFSLVRERSVDSLSTDALYEKAARGLVHSLGDPYAELYSRDELASFNRESLGGAYGGLGLQIEDHSGRPTIVRVFPHSPAASGGLRPGDEIIAVDSAGVRGWPLDKVSQALLGRPGTPVDVAVTRLGEAQPIRARYVRESVHVPSVPFSAMLDGQIGYVPLQVFSESAAQEVNAALSHLLTAGAKGIVLDVRGNGGGAVDQALLVANCFLAEGTELASVRERAGPQETYRAVRHPLTTTVPVAVLIDGGSASATEIVVGALQDHDRALVVGTTSFGKGLVQSLFALDGGYSLKLTTGRWYTPDGRSIQKPRKLMPDGQLVEIEPDSAGKPKPVFHSDAGRTVFGGGAITPDLAVLPDTLDDTERAFVQAITPASQGVYLATYSLARELGRNVKPDFTVQPAWRDSLFHRFQDANVPVTRAQFDAARSFVDRLLADRIAELAFPDSIAFRRRAGDDVQLARSLELLRRSRTQAELFVMAGGAPPAPAHHG